MLPNPLWASPPHRSRSDVSINLFLASRVCVGISAQHLARWPRCWPGALDPSAVQIITNPERCVAVVLQPCQRPLPKADKGCATAVQNQFGSSWGFWAWEKHGAGVLGSAGCPRTPPRRVTPFFGWHLQREGWLTEDAHPSPQLGSTSQTPKRLRHPCLHEGKGKKRPGICFCICF